jgi:YbbR domain-containing protein
VAERVKSGNGRLHALRPVPLNSPAVQSARRRFSWLWSRESVLRLALSLVLATALWIYVTGKENPNYIDFGQPIPVSTTNPNSNLIVTSPIPDVRVRYHPSNPNIFPTAASFTPYINLLNLGPGRHTVPVHVTADPGFSVVQVSPSHVTLVIEPKLQRTVRVVVRYVSGGSTPAEGYYALPAQIKPNVVTVTGPKSLVSQISDVAVTQSLSGAASTITESYKPVPQNSAGDALPSTTGLTIDPSPVSVTIPIRAVGGVKTLPVVVSVKGSPKAGLGVTGVSVDPSTITASGSPARLNALTTVSTSVNVAGKGAGTVRRVVIIHLGKGVSASPRRVAVLIHVGTVAASTSTNVAVRPVGVVGPGLAAHITPSTVLVTVVGPSSGLARATRGLDATVDVTGLSIGFYQRAPQITVPKGFTLHGYDPQLVSVSVEAAPTR